MNSSKNQSGSAHVIIVIILVLALIGSLGFIFWQNFAKNETIKQAQTNQKTNNNTVKTTSDNSSDETKLTEIAADNFTGSNLALKYPKTWQMTHESIGPAYDIVTEKYILSSPDNKIIINFWISNGGFGGTCEKTAGDELQYIKKDNLPTFSGAEYIEFYFSSGYFAGIRQNNMSVDNTRIGDSSCNYALSGAVLPVKNNKNIENMALHLEMEFPEIGHNGASSVEKFKEVIKTDNYKTAKNIVKSLYTKTN